MAERGSVLLSDFASNLFVSDKKRDLEKIIAVGNHHLTRIDEQQMAVLLLVRRTDIVKPLVLAKSLYTSQRLASTV